MTAFQHPVITAQVMTQHTRPLELLTLKMQGTKSGHIPTMAAHSHACNDDEKQLGSIFVVLNAHGQPVQRLVFTQVKQSMFPYTSTDDCSVTTKLTHQRVRQINKE